MTADPSDPARDTLFVDPHQAVEVARERHELQLTSAVRVPQICYYLSDDDVGCHLPNLIQVQPGRLIEFLALTRFRHPKRIVLPPGLDEPVALALEQDLHDAVAAGRLRRDLIAYAMAQECRNCDPWAFGGPRLRVLAMASRFTQVMQHSSRAMLREFERMGCETRFVIESSDMEWLTNLHLLQEHLDFKPHLTISINALNSFHLHPSVFNLAWWQDVAPPLGGDGGPLPWRDRDLVFALDAANWRGLFGRKGLPPHRVRQRGFGIDLDAHRLVPGVVRRPRSIVFVGSSYHGDDRCVLADAGSRRLYEHLEALFLRGEVLSVPQLDAITEQVRGRPEDGTTSCLWMLAMRRRVVSWLVELAEKGWQVGIYGQGWDRDPVARPFHKGMVSPGGDLARLYSEASHAVCLHPTLLNHQRLAEVACCGCIPVVWDNRPVAEPPHWGDDQVVYFRTRDQFLAGLERSLAIDPRPFAEHFSYRHFAQVVLDDMAAAGVRIENGRILPPCGTVR